MLLCSTSAEHTALLRSQQRLQTQLLQLMMVRRSIKHQARCKSIRRRHCSSAPGYGVFAGMALV